MANQTRAIVQRGTVVGDRYRITKLLGRGGFGCVFAAEHLHMKRRLAVKILNFSQDDIGHDEISARFTLEAESAARIDHPNVVTIYDFGFTKPGKQPYIAMQLLEGQDLDKLLRSGPINPERVIRLMVDCLDALGEAHRLGIIHKDLKPGNLFVVNPGSRREKICIVDFGLAFAAHARRRMTSQGQFVGTPQFASPEYLEHQITTPALDVYQIGLILVEMLTGRPVLSAKNFYRCVMAHCNAELPMPKALMESELGEVIKTALATDYKERYQNAMLFRDALEAIDPQAIPKDLADSPTAMLAEYIDVPSISRFRDEPKIQLPPEIRAKGLKLDTFPVTVDENAQPAYLDPVATLRTLQQYNSDETVLLDSLEMDPNATDVETSDDSPRPSALQVVSPSMIQRALAADSSGHLPRAISPIEPEPAPEPEPARSVPVQVLAALVIVLVLLLVSVVVAFV